MKVQSVGTYFLLHDCLNQSGADAHRLTTVLRKSVRFFIIDMFEISKKLSKLQGFIQGEWFLPISCLNDSETHRRGNFRELKSKKFTGEARPWTPKNLAPSALV